jgi:RNA polymerase sigma-70 factor (ECF subfamily)
MSATARKPGLSSQRQDLEEIFNAHHRYILRVAYHVTGNAEEAEDVLQTIFVRLAGRDCPPDLLKNPKGYLYRAAVNVSLNIIRQRRHTLAGEDKELQVEDLQPRQDRQYESAQVQAWFRQALADLSPRAAEMFVLKYIEGCGHNEIARLLNTSASTVAVTLFRTRFQLKKSIRHILGDIL